MKMECIECHITLNEEEVKGKYNNKCPMCNQISTYVPKYIMDIKRISTDESFVQAMIKLFNEDPIEFQLKMSQFKTQSQQQESVQHTKEQDSSTKITCPKCGSTNIQIVPRKWSLLTGFLTNKTDRVCVNCKHKF